MIEKTSQRIDLRTLILTVIVCFLIGLIPAIVVSRETSGYVASMSFGIITLFCGLPLLLIVFVISIIAATQKQTKFMLLGLMSCFLIPVSFFTSLKLLEFTKIAVYKRSGVDEMRSFETDAAKGWTIIYKKETTYEQRQDFANDTIHLYEPDKGFTGKSGVCETSGRLINEYFVETIYFCNASEAQKDILRRKLESSPLVYKFFENMNLDEIKKQNKELSIKSLEKK